MINPCEYTFDLILAFLLKKYKLIGTASQTLAMDRSEMEVFTPAGAVLNSSQA